MTIAPFARVPRDLDALSVERTLGGYALLEPIGAGGTATVWRARGADGCEVAVKRLHAPLADAVARRRFSRERELLERVGTHPAIVALLASGVSADGTGWYATPLHAFDLDAALDDRARASSVRIDERFVATLGLRLCAALAHAHAREVLHGDVKPANVLLDGAPGGADATLADFGSGWHADATLTRVPGLSRGYAAPERLAGAPPSVATDLYGLGATLRRVAAATSPPSGPSSELSALLDALVSPEPLDRPASARAAFERFAPHAPDAVRAALPPVAAWRVSTREAAADTTTGTDIATPVADAAAVRDKTDPARPRRGRLDGRAATPLAAGALAGALATFALTNGVGRPVSKALSGIACAKDAWLCERFDAGWGDWQRDVDPGVADFRLERAGGSSVASLRRIPVAAASFEDGGEAGDGSGTSSVSREFVAPVGASLRVASRVRIEPSGHAAHSWSNLVLLQATSGDVWSVNVGGGYTGDDRVAFDAYRHDPSGAHGATVAPGIAYGTGDAFCLEAMLVPVPAGLAFEYRIDGRLAGRFEHPARTGLAAPGGVERWRLTLGGPRIEGADAAPSVTWQGVVVDGGDGPDGCDGGGSTLEAA